LAALQQVVYTAAAARYAKRQPEQHDRVLERFKLDPKFCRRQGWPE
jgi:hypothetical protein